jgi:hypothetical protein
MLGMRLGYQSHNKNLLNGGSLLGPSFSVNKFIIPLAFLRQPE